MTKIIPIDENTRIKIIPDNYILQRKIKTRNNQIAWHTEGYFYDLPSLYQDYIKTAPYRANQSIESFEDLIKIIKEAEENILKSISKIENK